MGFRFQRRQRRGVDVMGHMPAALRGASHELAALLGSTYFWDADQGVDSDGGLTWTDVVRGQELSIVGSGISTITDGGAGFCVNANGAVQHYLTTGAIDEIPQPCLFVGFMSTPPGNNYYTYIAPNGTPSAASLLKRTNAFSWDWQMGSDGVYLDSAGSIVPNNEWVTIGALYDGANSWLRINSTTAITGNMGSEGFASGGSIQVLGTSTSTTRYFLGRAKHMSFGAAPSDPVSTYNAYRTIIEDTYGSLPFTIS